MHVRVSNVNLVCTLVLLNILTLLLLHMRANIEQHINRSGLQIKDSDVIDVDPIMRNNNGDGDDLDEIDDGVLKGSDGNIRTVSSNRQRNNDKYPPKSILIYSTLFGLKYWPTLNPEEITTFVDRCEYRRCNITYDKTSLSSVDAVLFHGVDILNEKDCKPDILQNLSKAKRRNQKWVFFIQESPDNYNGFNEYHGIFDWVMSYKHTSDIVVPYGHYKPLEKSDIVPENINYAKDKRHLGIWLVSNCGRPREDFMQELKKHLPLSVGGKCANQLFNESIKCDHGSQECHDFITSHKFFFSLENCFCDYYVTEKYWQKGIDWGLVPVVMGARYDQLNVIPGSYIDALQYKSIEELANYLKYLDSNDDAYNSYFKWKTKYKRIGYEKMCELCEALNENRYSRPYKDVWSAEVDCKPFQWKVDLLNQLVADSKMKKRS